MSRYTQPPKDKPDNILTWLDIIQKEFSQLQESYLRASYINSGSDLSYKKWKKRILRKMEKDNRK